MTNLSIESWRNDQGLENKSIYKKRFSVIPVKCSGNVLVWFKFYYKKYTIWYNSNNNNISIDNLEYYHIDFNENITEEEYIIRKLRETL